MKIAFLTCAGFAVLFAITNHDKLKNSKPTKKAETSYTEKYEGFQENTEISQIIFSADAGIEEHEILIKNSDKPLLINKDHNIYKVKSVYNIEYTIHEENQNLVGLSFLINKKKNTIKINVNGLKNKEKVTLKVDENIIHDSIPVDWAGNITLKASANNENSLKKALVCAQIQQQSNETRSICHYLEQKGDIV